jgi:hypothetical protein
MARRLQTMPLAKEKPSLAWSCERAGVALPRAQGDSRPHTAAYDGEAHGWLYLRLKEMEARGERIYGHLSAGVAPAAKLTHCQWLHWSNPNTATCGLVMNGGFSMFITVPRETMRMLFSCSRQTR